MRYLLTFMLSIFISYGALASETEPLQRTTSINISMPDVLEMKEEVPAVPFGYKVGHCYGRFLACWKKQKDDDQTDGLGLRGQKIAAEGSFVAGSLTSFLSFTFFNCGACGCCFNGDACCVRYVGSCCVFCGNGGCIIAAKWTAIIAAAICGLSACCYVSHVCCKDQSCMCQQSLSACDNCTKGIKDGYNKKQDTEPSQQTNHSYQDIAHLQML